MPAGGNDCRIPRAQLETAVHRAPGDQFDRREAAGIIFVRGFLLLHHLAVMLDADSPVTHFQRAALMATRCRAQGHHGTEQSQDDRNGTETTHNNDGILPPGSG